MAIQGEVIVPNHGFFIRKGFHSDYSFQLISFPGIGLPGVAASGTIAANTIAPVPCQLELMNELREKGFLQ